MSRDLKRLMQSLFTPAARSCGEACWQPSADIYRTPEGWLVKFDLAGVRPEDIIVAVQNSHLIVRGTRRDWLVEQGGGES